MCVFVGLFFWLDLSWRVASCRWCNECIFIPAFPVCCCVTPSHTCFCAKLEEPDSVSVTLLWRGYTWGLFVWVGLESLFGAAPAPAPAPTGRGWTHPAEGWLKDSPLVASALGLFFFLQRFKKKKKKKSRSNKSIQKEPERRMTSSRLVKKKCNIAICPPHQPPKRCEVRPCRVMTMCGENPQ